MPWTLLHRFQELGTLLEQFEVVLVCHLDHLLVNREAEISHLMRRSTCKRDLKFCFQERLHRP